MKCIFCKAHSANSKSIEHIVPESLGNKNQILSKGIVCDSCNNYFALKIEKPVLEMPYFQSLRGRNVIANKKGRIPKLRGLTKDGLLINFAFLPNQKDVFEVKVEDRKVLESLISNKELYVPVYSSPLQQNLLISKFIGKIAIEALAQRIEHIDNWQEDFVNNEELDELRYFVRYGNGYKIWPYNTRRIYSENRFEKDYKLNENYEILYEFDFLIPDPPTQNGENQELNNLYFVIAIMGIEYTINLTINGLERYERWIVENGNNSILLMEKSEFNQF